MSRADNLVEGADIHSDRHNGFKFLGDLNIRHQTPGLKNVGERDARTENSLHITATFISSRIITRTTGRCLYLALLCSGMPHQINTHKLHKTHRIAENLQRTSDVNSEGRWTKCAVSTSLAASRLQQICRAKQERQATN